MNEVVQDMSEMDWSGQGRTSPIDCRVTLAITGTTSEAFSHQRPVFSAAASHGFDVERVAVSRARSSADYHQMHMVGQSADEDASQPIMSALELSVRHAGPVGDAALAMQAFLADIPNELELVKVSVGGGGDYHGSDVVVIN